MRSRTLTTLTAILLAFAPAAAGHAAETGKTDKAAADQGATQPRTSIAAATAGDIVGKPVRDKDYKALGEVKFLMVDPKTGDVLYLVLGSAGGFDLGTQYTAVPWQAVDANAWVGWRTAGLTLKAARDKVAGAPRYDFEELMELVEPKIQVRLQDYYAALPGIEARQPGDGDRILVGADYMARMVAPLAQAENQIQGREIRYQASGLTLGEIDELMVDLDNGRVAYVLARQGGYLGIGGEWVPIPLQKLTWNTDHYVIDVEQAMIDDMPTLDPGIQPSWIRKGDLASLYEEFGVEPFWKD